MAASSTTGRQTMAFNYGGHYSLGQLLSGQPSQNDSMHAVAFENALKRSQAPDPYYRTQEYGNESEGPTGPSTEFSPHDFESHESRGPSDAAPPPLNFVTKLVAWTRAGANGEGRNTALQRIYNCLLDREKDLDLSGLSLKDLPYSCFVNLSHIKQLNISDNEISDIKDLPFYRLSNLEKLDAKSNKLAEIPAAITLCTNLRYLDITDNPKRRTWKCNVPDCVKFAIQPLVWPCRIIKD